MRNKKFKIFSIIVALFTFFFGITSIKAEVYNGEMKKGEYIPNVYIKKIRSNGKGQFKQMGFIRKSDGEAVYCIQPFVDVIAGAKYNVTDKDITQITGMSEEQWDRIVRLAYYGYGYAGHTDAKWWAVTQVLIWRVVDPSADIFFTNTLNGTRNNNKFINEINELNSLVDNHYVMPNITLPENAVIGSNITASDKNNVLSKYQIENIRGGKVTKNGNNLHITPNTVGKLSFNLVKSHKRYSHKPYLYYSDHSQNIMSQGDLLPLDPEYKINIFGGKVTVDKDDKEIGEAQGEAELQGAVYGVYDDKGTLIEKITTGKDGMITSNYLPKLGDFYVQEIIASKGYLLDTTKYPFTLTKDNLNPTIKVYEQVMKNAFNFTKVYAQNETGSMKPEPNATFGIYNNKNEEIFKATSDNNGNFNFDLPYGTYILRQLTTSTGTEKIKDMKLEVLEDGKKIVKVLANKQISAKLKVVKIDKDTKQAIKRSGIKFKILNIKTNEYVCQTITYPYKKTICEYETDKNGEFITPYPLLTGTYKLEEVDQVIDGYLWNKESKEFSIDENTKITNDEYGIIFETSFENKEVKGEVKLHKLGEEAVLGENGYTFVKKPLADVEFGLYQDGTEIAKTKTDKDGNLTFSNLKLGKYCIRELKTLDGYVLNKDPMCFELKYKDQYTEIVTYELELENKLKTSKFEFTKTDFSTAETLPNTVIEIYTNDDELVFKGKTDKDGKIIIDRLPVGKYYILEKEAPKGYILNEEKMYFEVTGDGVVKSSMKNHRLVEVPDTDAKDLHTLIISGSLMILLGIALFVYNKKNKK